MKDIPIIFSAPMVNALLREVVEIGTGKTMTRRLAWSIPRSWGDSRPINYNEQTSDPSQFLDPTPWQKVKAGDRLWVREAFCHYRERCKDSSTGFVDWVHYRATDEDDFLPGMKWRPSIHMQRIHSRLTLVVTRTKIERLQNINEQDCEQEGLVWAPTQKIWGVNVEGGYSPYGLTAQECFMHLFCDLHGPSIWHDNPEVVAISFTVHRQNIDAMKTAA